MLILMQIRSTSKEWRQSRSRPTPGTSKCIHLRKILLIPTKLVIVGKQSAGKSSLLQSLTDIPFPVGTRLCTRFATRIVSKRIGPSESDLVRASIEHGDVNPFNYREDDIDADSFNRIVPSMSVEEFESIVKDVTSTSYYMP